MRKPIVIAGILACVGLSTTTRAEPDAGMGVVPGAFAILDIASDPAARIFVDDVDTKKITPQVRLEVSPGHHKLTLVTLDGARQRMVGVMAEAGQTRKLTVHLAP